MKRIPIAKIRYLYETNRWDGPLSGFCEVGGKRYYFLLFGEVFLQRPLWWPFGPGRTRVRTFRLYDPPAEVWARLDECHEDFRKWVGTHCDYDEQGQRIGEVAPQRLHDKFYRKWKDNKDDMKDEWLVATYVETCKY
jgi:hypothetical protein